MWGPRGTGKTKILYWHGIICALMVAGLQVAFVRDTYPNLEKTVLRYIESDLKKLGQGTDRCGTYSRTSHIAEFKNGSRIYFVHAGGSDSNVGNLLGSEFHLLLVDELSTIQWELFAKLIASVRAAKDFPFAPQVVCGTNPLGVSAHDVKKYFIDHDVDPAEDCDYLPQDWVAIRLEAVDNEYIDIKEYRKQFSTMSSHTRKAWLDGEFVEAGAYFDFTPTILNEETLEKTFWHVIDEPPPLVASADRSGVTQPAPYIYRAIDWGWHDPTVCLWIAVYPSGRIIPFQERSWIHTPPEEVAVAIKALSEGMRVVDTFIDPNTLKNSEATGSDIGDIIRDQGIPVTKGINDRTAAGLSIAAALGTILHDGKPKLQIYSNGPLGCPNLVKTLPQMQMDHVNQQKLRDSSHDHWVITLSYLLTSDFSSPRLAKSPTPWSEPASRVTFPKSTKRLILGKESIRNR